MGVLCPGPGRGLDEVGAERAALLAEIDAGPTAIFFAATKPERVNALILSHTTAKFVATDDYPIGIPPEVAEELVAQIDQLWGSEALAAMVAPSRAGDQRFRRWSGKLVRAGASPGAAQRFLRALLEVDVRRLVEEFGGQLIKTTGDGMLATFDGPGRAIRCAAALRDELAGIGVQLRAGLHTGEVELRDRDVGGIAVHIAARVMTAAQPGDILASRTVRDLVVGSDITLHDHGTQPLKGLEGSWQLFSAMRP